MGICGAAAASGRTEIVDDVNADPRYLACFTTTRSEIVVPIFAGGQVTGEIDIDGSDLAAYDETDARFLEEIAALLAPLRPRTCAAAVTRGRTGYEWPHLTSLRPRAASRRSTTRT